MQVMEPARFYCEALIADQNTVTLPSSVAHHVRVRRLRAGQAIVLFDGSGSEYLATLHFDEAGRATAEIAERRQVSRELQGSIVLIQGLASQDKMDWIIEKAVELGVSQMIPVAASRSVLKLSAERLEKRLEHWRRIVVSASEQSGRNVLMRVDTPRPVDTIKRSDLAEPAFLCHLSQDTTPLHTDQHIESMKENRQATVIVGPEGGWSPTEAQHWISLGAKPVTLGNRILRTETAGLAASAMIASMMHW